MADLGKEITRLCDIYQQRFNSLVDGSSILTQADTDHALQLFLSEILNLKYKPKWKLFSLYVIYQLICKVPSSSSRDLVHLLVLDVVVDVDVAVDVDVVFIIVVVEQVQKRLAGE